MACDQFDSVVDRMAGGIWCLGSRVQDLVGWSTFPRSQRRHYAEPARDPIFRHPTPRLSRRVRKRIFHGGSKRIFHRKTEKPGRVPCPCFLLPL